MRPTNSAVGVAPISLSHYHHWCHTSPPSWDWGTVPDACFIILTSMGVAAPESRGWCHLLSARPSTCTWWTVQHPVTLKFKEKPDAKWSCWLNLGNHFKFAQSGVLLDCGHWWGCGGGGCRAAPCRGHTAGAALCQYSSSPVTAASVSARKANYFSSGAQRGPCFGPFSLCESLPPADRHHLILGAVAKRVGLL